jgi:hypothetical protein
MSLRIDLTDPVNVLPRKRTTLSLELKSVDDPEEPKPGLCAELVLAKGQGGWSEPWLISSEGLRAFARAALCMANEIEARQADCRVPK